MISGSVLVGFKSAKSEIFRWRTARNVIGNPAIRGNVGGKGGSTTGVASRFKALMISILRQIATVVRCTLWLLCLRGAENPTVC